MATPITWRNVNNVSNNGAVELFKTGTENLTGGLSRLGRQATNFGNQLSQEQLTAALSQINNLGSVDAVREATNNGFLGSLNLSDENRLKASEALSQRENTLGEQFVNRDNYDTTRRNIQDRPVLENALTQISQLTDVDAIRTARDNGTFNNLNLSGGAQREVTQALRDRETGAGNLFINRDSFDTTKTSIEERPKLNEIQERLNALDFGGARELAEGMSNSGELLGRIQKAEKDYTTNTNKQNYTNQLIESVRGRQFADENNSQLSQDFLYNNPEYDGILVPSSGGLLTVNEDVYAGYSQEEKQRLSGELDGVIGGIGYSLPQSYDSISENLIANLNPDVGVEGLNSAAEFLEQVKASDSSYQNQVEEDAVFKNAQRQLIEFNLAAFKEDNPYDNVNPLRNKEKVNETINSYLDLAKGNNTVFNVGDGDFEEFSGAVNKAIERSGVDVTANVLTMAIDQSPAIKRAMIEGNLGDMWGTVGDGDNVNVANLADLILKLQTEYNTTNNRAKQGTREATTNSIRQLSALDLTPRR